MLLRFSVRNFRSIYEQQDLTLYASRFTSMPKSVFTDRKVPAGILPMAAIYGSNAAGKSNLLRSMHYMYKAVSESHNKWRPQMKLSVDPHFFHKDEPSEFECEFLIQKEIYRFGFVLDEEKILKEYLYLGRTLLYSRSGNRYRIGELMKDVSLIKKSTRPNSLFISAGAQNNHPILRKVHAWFSSWQTVTDDRTHDEALAGFATKYEGTRAFLAKALSIISPDVQGLEAGEDADISESGDSEDDSALFIDRWKWMTSTLTHGTTDGKKTAKLILAQESRGIQSYFTLTNTIMLTLALGSILLLDEADQSLHPTLLRSILALFQNPLTNPNKAQLIFNTHDTSLLSPEVLRPDEVWFVERNAQLESKIFSLTDFDGIRSDTKTERAYLEGRFGAVPFLDGQQAIFATYLAELRGQLKHA